MNLKYRGRVITKRTNSNQNQYVGRIGKVGNKYIIRDTYNLDNASCEVTVKKNILIICTKSNFHTLYNGCAVLPWWPCRQILT